MGKRSKKPEDVPVSQRVDELATQAILVIALDLAAMSPFARWVRASHTDSSTDR